MRVRTRGVSLENIEGQLARVNVRLAALAAEMDRTSGRAINPDGEIGGMRGRSRRAKGQIIARWDRQAAEHRELVAARTTLEGAIRAADRRAAAQGQDEQAPAARPSRKVAPPILNRRGAHVEMTRGQWMARHPDSRGVMRIHDGTARVRTVLTLIDGVTTLVEVFLTDVPARENVASARGER